METTCWLCADTREMTDAMGATIPCMICQSAACDAACAALNAATAQPQPTRGVCPRCDVPLTGSEDFGRSGPNVCPRCWNPPERWAPAQPLPIPTTPLRTGKTNYFPRKASSFAVTDLTGADAATMAATIKRDFSRFIR